MIKKLSYTIASILFAGFSATLFAQPASPLRLWYDKPAGKWTDALPVGNGRLGAMIFGGVDTDRIQFNEETLWTGSPRNYNRPGAYAYLGEIRKRLSEGKQADAETLAQAHFMGALSETGSREAWLAGIKSGKGLAGNPAEAAFDDSKWKLLTLPAYEGWESKGLEGVDGAVWLRTDFNLPSAWQGKNLVLDLNRIRDQDITYVNGKMAGATTGTDPRKYTIPAAMLRAGKNVLAIQVINFNDKGGLAGYKDTSRHIGIFPEDGSGRDTISLHKAWRYFIQDQDPPDVPHYQADYQPFGDLFLRFNGHEHPLNYKRELDIDHAVARTSYTIDGVNYTREYIASQPDQVIAIRLAASKRGALRLDALLSSPHRGFSVRKINDNTVALSVRVKGGALRGEAYLRVINSGGSLKMSGNTLAIDKADEVMLLLTAATNFKNYKDVSGDPDALCSAALSATKGKNFQRIFAAHDAEYRQYYDKFSLQLGAGNMDTIPTDKRIALFASRPDPSFAALYVQYGRYLLIASSRPGTKPSNLQGIWNDLLTPPWGSKYTTNINAEMNYWPAELLNLSPLHQPLFDMTRELSETGHETARQYYNAPGWVLHHNTDLWRGTAPINASNHGIWVTGGAWLCHHLWQHYLYTQDKAFLAKTAYPLMKEAALFFDNFLVRDAKTGWLISTPSNSPEHLGLVAGPAMDHQIIRDLFKNTDSAAGILGIDQALRDTLALKFKQLAPNQVGANGRLQEWLEDKEDKDQHHRHVSHLWGQYPGNEINWDDSPVLMQAAMNSLLHRGDAATGWSLAWKINFWARFKDGDHAYKLITMLISPAETNGAGSYHNLFDAHPPFQIDGNFGGAAGIGEMLVQSHTRYIDLLPALPTAFAEGQVTGICTRGGLELAMKWTNGKLASLEILSKAGLDCPIRYAGKTVTIKTVKGKTYRFNGELAPVEGTL